MKYSQYIAFFYKIKIYIKKILKKEIIIRIMNFKKKKDQFPNKICNIFLKSK